MIEDDNKLYDNLALEDLDLEKESDNLAFEDLDHKKESDNLKEEKQVEKGSNNLVKGTVNNYPELAKQILCDFQDSTGNKVFNVDNIEIGSTYYIIYQNYYRFPADSDFVRGQERTWVSILGTDGRPMYMKEFHDDIDYLASSDIAVYVTSTPQPEVPELNETVSMNEIINEIRGLRQDVQNLANTTFSVSISDNNVSDNQAISVSDNIIYKQLKDYNTSESMALIGLMLGFTAMIVYFVHKSILRWKR